MMIEAPNRGVMVPDGAGHPFRWRARAFSSPVAMALGLAILAVSACAIALGGLFLLAGDGRAPERVAPGAQLLTALQPSPRPWADVPAILEPAAPAPAQAPLPAAPPAPQAEASLDEPALAEGEPGTPVEGVPVPPRRDLAEAQSFAGVWAPDAAACSPRANRRGFLPAVINSEGAWAGETSCAFASGQQTGSTWRFSAVCSNTRRRWKADVRLTVNGDRLVWTSQRGSQAYVRCARTSRDT